MWQVILSNLIPIVFAFATPMVLILARELFKALAKKFHLDAALAYEDKVEQWISMGMDAAEKKSLNAIKAGQPKTPGEQKLADVIKFVNDQLVQHDLPQKAADAVGKIVDAKLMARMAPAPTAVATAAVLTG